MLPIDASQEYETDPYTFSDGEFDGVPPTTARSSHHAKSGAAKKRLIPGSSSELWKVEKGTTPPQLASRKRKRKTDKIDEKDEELNVAEEETAQCPEDIRLAKNLGFRVPTGFKFQPLVSACDELHISDSQTDESVGST